MKRNQQKRKSRRRSKRKRKGNPKRYPKKFLRGRAFVDTWINLGVIWEALETQKLSKIDPPDLLGTQDCSKSEPKGPLESPRALQESSRSSKMVFRRPLGDPLGALGDLLGGLGGTF